MKYKIYVDGQEGTTGLKILERFNNRSDIELLTIDENLRKDINERKKFINASDFTFLCLPDDAAREAVSLAKNENVRIIDASTAHRTNTGWAYGLPELSSAHRERIRISKRVSVPGCYASGFAALVYPLVRHGVISPDFPVFCHAVSGYSGAGKNAVKEYEGADKPNAYFSPRAYALTQEHKHIPEMKYASGLEFEPMFNPMVDDYFCGMLVHVPVQTRMLNEKHTVSDIERVYKEHYKGQNFIKVAETTAFLAANELSGKNYMELFVTGNKERILLTARLDNLGKGASGAAVQCMNIMMGIDETTGLI